MDAQHWLADRFEADRSRLQAMAYRMLGSLSEADDAVQESWLKVSRADTSSVENISGWLTTSWRGCAWTGCGRVHRAARIPSTSRDPSRRPTAERPSTLSRRRCWPDSVGLARSMPRVRSMVHELSLCVQSLEAHGPHGWRS